MRTDLLGDQVPAQSREAQTRARARHVGNGGANHQAGGPRQSRAVPLGYQPPGQVNIGRWNAPTAHGDLMEFMRMYGYVGSADPKRRVSERTFSVRKQTLLSTFKAIRERNRGIKTLSQFTPRLIPSILEYWSEEGADGHPRHSYETQVQDFSVLAWFWKMHGIRVEPIKHYVEDPQLKLKFKRTSVATTDKSWDGNSVDVDEIIELARKEDPVVARLIELARDFGLRAKETLFVRPHEDDKGDRLHLSRGTKTGRPRDIEYEDFDEDYLKEAIEAVKDQLQPGQHTAWQGRTLKEAYNRLYYVLKKIGVTKKDRGVTFHGLRAQWAIDQFKRLTGTEVPVRGGGAINYHKLAEDRRKIMRALGHNRLRVGAAYYGSFFKMKDVAEQRFRESWNKLLPLLPALQTVLERYGLDNAWLVGRRANGANHQTAEPFDILLDDRATLAQAASATMAIIGALENELGVAVRVHSSRMSGENAKAAWAENALPLFDVEPPLLESALEKKAGG